MAGDLVDRRVELDPRVLDWVGDLDRNERAGGRRELYTR